MKQPQFTDQELIKGIAQGNAACIQSIYDDIQPVVIKWMLTRGAESSLAEDVFQEGMMVLYHQSRKIDFQLTSKLSTYLLAICKRLWFKQIRKNENTILKESFTDEEMKISEEEIAEVESKEMEFKQLEVAMELLGSPCKEVLEAFYLEGLNMMELAERFDYTNANTAKTQRYKCMNRLRKMMNS